MLVSVVGDGTGQFLAEARRRLTLEGVELCGEPQNAEVLVLLGEDAAGNYAADVALLPGTAVPVKARCAISYGMSPKDTVTVSSVREKQLAISVQREFDTLDGRRVCIQELTLDWGLSPHRALPVAALGLLTGELGESAYAAP